jgi:N-acetylglucosaminyldiphosphoundecaprenol N-acetyl-beta-D-mannosaminyltransferase
VIDRGRRNVLGILIDAVDYRAASQRVIEAAHARRPMAVSALAVHGLMTGVLDPVQRYRLNSFELLVPDGQPVRWALNWLHQARLADRVYGPRLMLELCERAAAEDLSVFLFGGAPALLDDLQRSLTRRFPALRIAGTRASRFRRLSVAERDDVVATIRDSGAAITLVGLGCPRQEVWAFEFRGPLSMPVIAVGAAFAFHAGHVPQASPFLQDWGLEWLYRLAQEPRRLWRRYLLLNPLYACLLMAQLAGIREFDPKTGTAPSGQMLFG